MDDKVTPVIELGVLESIIVGIVEAAARIMGLAHEPTSSGSVRLGEEYLITGIGETMTNTYARVPEVDFAIAQTKLDYAKLWEAPEAIQLRELVAAKERRRGSRRRDYMPGAVVRTIIHDGSDPWIRNRLNAFARDEAVRLRDFLASDATRILSSAPLVNFDCPGRDSIRLRNSIWLRRLSQRERASLLSSDRWKQGHATVLDLTEARRTAWAIETEHFAPETLGGFLAGMGGSEDFSGAFDRVVSGLRLFKSANVGRCEITDFEEPFHRPMWHLTTPHFSTEVDPFDALYRIEPDEAASLIDFLGRYERETGSSAFTPLSVAIQRYNDTFYHERPEERELDCVISLESLLGPRGPGLARKFAVRGSVLFAETPADRERIRSLLKSAYQRRSDLIHRGRKQSGPHIVELIETTRRAILRYMQFPAQLRAESALLLVDDYARLARPATDVVTFVLERSALTQDRGNQRPKSGER